MLLQVSVNMDQSNAKMAIALRKIKFAYHPEAVISLRQSFPFASLLFETHRVIVNRRMFACRISFLIIAFHWLEFMRIIIITIITKYFPPCSIEEFRELDLFTRKKSLFFL